MPTSTFFSGIQIVWTACNLLLLTVMVAIAIIQFRRRATGSLLMLGGAVLSAIMAIAARVYPIVIQRTLPSGVDRVILIQQTLLLGAFFGQMVFLIGVLLQALRSKAEGDRVVQLEAILRDRDEHESANG
ncbi:hypothetical protein [Luteolibacter marinus]|uniref:hypothetical protein n=1 Tax=Luteolibacter marinus TaxID=2776705 RepID=UPI0018662ADD|nr:hypothetical protein [Luteolibacter marinus]